MAHPSQIIFYGATILITFFLVSFNIHWSEKSLLNERKKDIDHCPGEPVRDTITPLKGQKAFIIAPYYDNRKENVIRILGIVHHKEVVELYCHFCCSVNKTIPTTRAEIQMHQDRFGFPYGLSDIICAEPPNCKPKHVFVHWNSQHTANLTKFPIRNRERGEFKANFTVCISTMFGNYSNILQFIQTIEMYKILGAQKVDVYLNNCSQHMAEVLQFYRREGTVEIIPWHIHRYLKISNSWRLRTMIKNSGITATISHVE
ncbi:hypothetical protein GDO86_014829 [Hymenochirus boettgeri]|uniref:Glycosyltransferase family 92 protein n=1 Tax=Hymenochirus boettgeri TaxID=247094 RepID=A0A8T2JVR7_9PIPI|nr:hypothetical protein GDO86_014829 [Hymenochirus boettgeri]